MSNGADRIIKEGYMGATKMGRKRVKRWLKKGVDPAKEPKEFAALEKAYKAEMEFLEETEGI